MKYKGRPESSNVEDYRYTITATEKDPFKEMNIFTEFLERSRIPGYKKTLIKNIDPMFQYVTNAGDIYLCYKFFFARFTLSGTYSRYFLNEYKISLRSLLLKAYKTKLIRFDIVFKAVNRPLDIEQCYYFVFRNKKPTSFEENYYLDIYGIWFRKILVGKGSHIIE